MTGEIQDSLQTSDNALHGLLPLRPLIIAARKMGIDVEATCREAEVEAPRIERGELAIEPSSLFGFLTALDQKATSSPLGLAAAEALSQAELAFLDDGPPIAANLGEATARVIELFPLATRTSALRLEEHGREVVLVLETSREGAGAALYAEYILAALLSLARRITGRDLAPMEVSFRHGGGSRGAHERFFRAPVAFGARRDAMTFPREFLELPLPHPEPEPTQAFTECVAVDSERYAPQPSLTERVRSLLGEGLRSGEISIDDLARRLQTSRRTLQRHLQRLGTSHSALLDDVRRELAMGYIRDGRASVTQVARTLGFADASTFARAFRRWTGRSPMDYRGAQAVHA